MSLINQMLKDLDKRGTEVTAGNVARGTIRSVPERGKSSRLVWWLVLVLVLALAGAYAWITWLESMLMPTQAPAPIAKFEPALPPVQLAPTPASGAVVPLNEPIKMVKAAPSAVITPSKPAEEKKLQAAPVAKSDKPVALTAPKSERVTSDRKYSAAVPIDGAMRLAMSGTLASITVPETKTATARERGKRGAPAAEQPRLSKETTPQQQADNAYERAIALIGAGQKAEAISTLENVLVQNPRHASARQTLVSLLLDGKRSDEAVRVLKDGLLLDPAQSGMAMILARVQVEKGDTKAALATLQHSLPYAAQKPDYQAFLAALLQREKRHKEAAEHYRNALRLAPNNGVWWMGYGISLQAENRLADARTAFIHARDSERLTPELRAFVEQRIGQLQ